VEEGGEVAQVDKGGPGEWTWGGCWTSNFQYLMA
jgi:hypothetical protein